MGELIQLKAADGFELDAYMASPSSGEAKGAVLVIQEIFGVNVHIREVCDGYAGNGYVALAPAIFDRAQKGVELGYEAEDIARGADFARKQLKPAQITLDLVAAVDHLQQFGNVAVVGYCFGGFLAWKCAAELDGIKCACGYYGGGITASIDMIPKVPTLLHFGRRDEHIPVVDVEKVIQAHPDIPVYLYDADHGFNCDHRSSFDAAASKQALERTLAFFGENLA
jgi:carboxymethylenebutenolidase